MSLLSYPWTCQPYRTESLHPPGYPVTFAVFRYKITGTFCRNRCAVVLILFPHIYLGLPVGRFLRGSALFVRSFVSIRSSYLVVCLNLIYSIILILLDELSDSRSALLYNVINSLLHLCYIKVVTQSYSGGKISILGFDSIGRCRKRNWYLMISEVELLESPDLTPSDFCLWGLMKSEV